MASSSLCVRVSVFQAKKDPRGAGVSNAEDAQKGKTPSSGSPARLLRSSIEDYRGDLLLPLHALSPSAVALQDAEECLRDCMDDHKTTVAHLIEGLEQRLSEYCVLHVPTAAAIAFVQENCMSESSLEPFFLSSHSVTPLSNGKDEEEKEGVRCSASATPSRFCAACSTSLAKAAATSSTSLPDEKSPWISIVQLQRLPGKLGYPSLPALTAEEWMLRQHGCPASTFVSDDEADALHIETVSRASPVEGGECYAAFFRLQMIPLGERAARLRALHVAARATPPQLKAAPQSFLTVQALNHTVRIGVPPPLPTLVHGGALQRTPDLKQVVFSRLQAQRGVAVRRLLDPLTGAAVLPCETTTSLLAASLSTLAAECGVVTNDSRGGRTQQLQGPSEASPTAVAATATATQTQRLSRLASLEEDAVTTAGTTAHGTDPFDHLVGLCARRRGEEYYYDGFDSHHWAEQRTAISISELPSESELRMTSVASVASSATAIYPPNVSSRTTASIITASAENSRSLPFAIMHDEGEEVSNIEAVADGVAGEKGSAEEEGKSSSFTAHGFIACTPVHHADTASCQSGAVSIGSGFTQLGSENVDRLDLRDSLRDMNEVFLYEEEETIGEPQGDAAQGDEGDGQHRQSSTQQRRSSLVWSTPAARGSAGGFQSAEVGVSATPLTYRTCTQLSPSPQRTHSLTEGREGTLHGRVTTTLPAVPLRLSLSSSSLSPLSSSASRGSRNDNTKEAASAATEESSDEESEEASFQHSSDDEARLRAARAEADIGSEEEGENDDDDNGDAVNEVGSVDFVGMSEEDASSSSTLSTTPSNTLAPPDRPSASNCCSRSKRDPISGDRPPHLQTSGDESRTAATPPRQRVDASTSGTSGRHQFACTPPSLSAASASASSPSSRLPPVRVEYVRSPPQRSTAVLLGEGTTPLPSCSTPPSRSCTFKREVRSHLQRINPVSTQNSQPASQGGESTNSRGHRNSVKRPRTDEEQQSPVFSHTVHIARASSHITPDGVYPTSAPTSSVRTGSALSSLPSTVAANKATRHRSPIYFSPAELAGMAADPVDGAGRNTSDLSDFASSAVSSLAESAAVETEREKEESGRPRTPPGRGYGPFVAAYPFRESDLDDSTEGVARWDHASHASHPSSSPRKHLPPYQPRHSTPQRLLASVGPELSNVGLSPPFSEQRRCQQRSSQPISDGALLPSAPRVTSQRLRCSESQSASGVESWVRFNDAEGEETNKLCFMGEEDSAIAKEDYDDEEVMLVTQQEIPDFAVQTDSSGSDDDEEEEGVEDDDDEEH
jgi:hypothetical protein